MKIMYSLPPPNMVLSKPGGAAIRALELMHGFEQLGHQVIPVWANDVMNGPVRGETAMYTYRAGIKRIFPIIIAVTLRDIGYLVHNRVYTKKLEEVTRREKPDFLVEEFTPFHKSAVTVGEKLGIPVIIDDIPPTWEGEVYFERTLKRLVRKIEKEVFVKALGLIAVSGYLKEFIHNTGIPYEKIHIVHNGTDCQRFHPGISGDNIRQEYGLNNKLVIGFVGGFLPYHGVDILLKAAQIALPDIPDLHLLLVGDGITRPKVETLVEQSPLQGRVTFTGKVPNANVPQYIAAMDITTMPHSNVYGSPMKIIEYMAMGKPTIAPGFSPIQEIITDGKNGFLFSPQDEIAFAKILVEIAHNPSLQQAVGQEARKTILEDFTWVKQAQRIVNIVL